MNEIFPIGVPLRWANPTTDRPALELLVAHSTVEVDDDLAALAWRLLGGEPTLRPDGGFGREELVSILHREYGGDGTPAEGQAVFDAVDHLVSIGAAAEFDTSDATSLQAAASALRLRPLGGVLGADARHAGRHHLGAVGLRDLPVSTRELELVVRCDSGGSLWDLAHEMSRDVACHGIHADVDWTNPAQQLPFLFFEVRRLLWHNLALLDRID